MGNILTISEGTRVDTGTSLTGIAQKLKYTYDAYGQLTREDNKYLNKSIVYSYDAGGNITSKKEYAYTTGTLGTATKTISYTYGDTNWKDKLTNYNGTAITYDAIGNPLSYKGITMTWQGRQLTQAVKSGTTIKYTYGADGLRASKTVGSKKQTFQYVGGKLMYENRGDGREFYYAYDPFGNLSCIRIYDNGEYNAYYVVCNSRGDVEAIYTSSGVFKARYIYDAWGNTISIQNSSGQEITDESNIAVLNRIRYRGYYWDAETSLYYVGSRYYDPVVSRWINADDASNLGAEGEVLSYNLFAYCLNNPVNRFDVDGNWSMPNSAKIAIGVGAIAVGVIATVATGGVAAPVLAASIKIAMTSATIGAISGAGVSVVIHRISTGSWDGSGKAAVTGAIDGACDGFMWGGITAGATFTTAAIKGIRIQEIGRLKPSNKSGEGYPGVKYQIKKPNGHYTTKSFELHSPHSSGPHNVWHWQQNTWNSFNNSITGSAKHWRIFGGRL